MTTLFGEQKLLDSRLTLGPLGLQHGGSVPAPELAWRLFGAADAPVVVALGGISAHRRTHAAAGEEAGWWQGVVSEGAALDTRQCRVLSFDYLGGWGDSTAPTPNQPLPAISPFDQAELLHRLLDHLQLPRVRAIVGASYGGMVGLAFAQRYPQQVEQLAIISAAERTHPMATAWRSVQRNLLRFAVSTGNAAEGLKLARALAMSTYRSPAEFSARFSSEPRFDGGRARFPVEDYLLARGAHYAERYSAESFLCLSESIDLHAVDAPSIAVPTRALGAQEDQLVPIADMRALCARLPQASLREISSLYGHDAFLKEIEILREWLQPVTGEMA